MGLEQTIVAIKTYSIVGRGVIHPKAKGFSVYSVEVIPTKVENFVPHHTKALMDIKNKTVIHQIVLQYSY